jgi:hypothetical protein
MAVISIAAIVRLQRRLHTGRNMLVLAITLLVYAAQLGFGVLLLVESQYPRALPLFCVGIAMLTTMGSSHKTGCYAHHG